MSTQDQQGRRATGATGLGRLRRAEPRSRQDGDPGRLSGPGPADATSPSPAMLGSAQGSVVTPGVRAASEWTWRLALIAGGIYLLTRIAGEFSEILIPVLIALLLVALLHPITDRLARVMPRPLATILTMLGGLLLLAGLFALVGQQTASGFTGLREQASQGIAQVQSWLSTGPLHLSSNTLATYLTRAQDAVKANQSKIASGALGVFSSATHLAEGLAITLFSTFFFLLSGQRIWAWVLRLLPERGQAPLDSAVRSGYVVLSHYVRATLIVAMVDGLGVGIGAALLGVPLALPLGVVVFIGAFIPIVGALLTGVLAILVALVAKGLTTALLVLLVVIAVNQLEAHVLQPFLLGHAVEVHPLAVILGLAAGSALAGIVGALFAVPTIAVGNTILTALVGRRRDPGERAAADDAPLSPDKPAPTDTDRVAHEGGVRG